MTHTGGGGTSRTSPRAGAKYHPQTGTEGHSTDAALRIFTINPLRHIEFQYESSTGPMSTEGPWTLLSLDQCLCAQE